MEYRRTNASRRTFECKSVVLTIIVTNNIGEQITQFKRHLTSKKKMQKKF